MIIFYIILAIVIIAACVGLIATVADLFKTRGIHKPFGPYERFVKRGLDAFLATGALIVFLPVLTVTSILVRIKLGSPVFFIQERPGKDGKIFKLYKFRTMLPPKNGIIDPAQDAARLTPFGSKLRSTSLDELPELINMIKGDMAVVGPRPFLTQYLSRYNAYQARRHEVRPGFTGLAQVHGRNDITWEEKFDWDVKYVDRITFLGDCKIVFDTLKVVVKRDGINAVGEATMGEFMGSKNR
ncbi:MAG: sugar transferase [Clostridia bacterium]|nr:sugar transferase [Clostridia bacterium]